MTPVLYSGTETAFYTNGIGRLADCIRCICTEERNGIYEVEFDYPIEGVHFDDIEAGKIITATHDDTGDIQPFIIYRRTVPDLRGVVTFYAHHISYKLNDIVVMPYSAGSCADALQGIIANSATVNPFTFWTDKTTVANFKNAVPRNARNMLGGEQNSILDVFGGGDYEFDKFNVKLHAHRGADSDVEIRYAKNLTNLSEDSDISTSYNAIVPYWADTDGHIVMLPEKVIIYSGLEPVTAYLTDHNLIIIRTETDEPIEVAFSEVKAAPMDLSAEFEAAPTEAELRQAAQTRFERSGAWLPSENLKVDFIQMWQTEEYKDYAPLQRVRLCDTVSVYYPQVGINKVKQRVIRTEYNVLLDRYDSIELGALQTSLGRVIKSDILQEVPTTSMMDAAIKYATDMIRGGLGGYVVMTPGIDGYPQEILIMDEPDVNTAVNVWRFNQGGLGHSHSGYDGPFDDIALTQDGKINASLITVGALNAGIITTGVLKDANNNTSFNLSTGAFSMKKGSIDLGNGNFTVNDSGVLGAKTGKIGPFNIGETALTYTPSSANVSIGQSNITYKANYVESSSSGWRNVRKGVVLSGDSIAFQRRNDQSSWSLTEIGRIAVHRTSSDVDTIKIQIGSTDIAYFYEEETLILNDCTLGSYGGRNQHILYGDTDIYGNVYVLRTLEVMGTKSRRVKTDNYSDRLHYCYETPTPLFGDIGEAVIDEDGLCYVDIDDIFSETIAGKVEYQVFLQAEGEGTCYISDKNPRFFVISGSPGLKVAWEIKAKQKDYENIRLEQAENNLDEYENIPDDNLSLESYIAEQEGLLYGNY